MHPLKADMSKILTHRNCNRIELVNVVCRKYLVISKCTNDIPLNSVHVANTLSYADAENAINANRDSIKWISVLN